MSSARERVEEELTELASKFNKLNAFLGTEKANALDSEQLELLMAQQSIMGEYIEILQQRLDIWED